MNPYKVTNSVTPAAAGVYNYLKLMDPRLRGDDNKEGFSTFYETINFNGLKAFQVIDERTDARPP